jgi:hypothetical protein
LTIKTHSNLIEKLIEYAKIRIKIDGAPIRMASMLIEIPEYLLIQNFPPGFFDDDFKKIFNTYNSFEPFKNNILEFKMYQRMMNNHVNRYSKNSVNKLKDVLTESDKKRNTNWKETFKWLYDFSFDEDAGQRILKYE